MLTLIQIADPFYTLPNARYNTGIASQNSSHNFSLPCFRHTPALDGMVGTSKVTDWGEQQSRSSASLWTSSTQASTFKSMSADAQASALDEPKPSINYARRNMPRVYSIPTLLKLGQMKQPAHVELRISPAALAENVFKIPSIPWRSKLQENLHPRRQTQSSGFTGRSTLTEEDAMYDSTYIRPSRQPLNPPEVSLIQKHAGFARFLKQHASPPSHRVTAGGRIVPAGPLSPPPMMVLPSINTMMNDSGKHFAGKAQGGSTQAERRDLGIPESPFGASTFPLGPQQVNKNYLRPSPGLESFANPQYPHAQIPQLGQNGSTCSPIPVGATPLGFLPDGSSLVFYNGMSYQSFWDGRGAIMKPLQFPIAPVSQQNYASMLYPHMAADGQYYGSYPPNGFMHHKDTNGPQLMTNGTGQAQEDFQQSSATQLGDPQALHNQLAAELSELDKFAALHLHELTPAENAQYTSRRRQLVKQLDSLRSTTENNKIPGLLREHLNGMQAVPSWLTANHIAESSIVPQVDGGTGNIHAAVPSTPSNMDSHRPGPIPRNELFLNRQLVRPQPSANKSLSPFSAPFVPSGLKAAAAEYFGNGEVSRNTGAEFQEQPAFAGATTAVSLVDRTLHGMGQSVRDTENSMSGPDKSSKCPGRGGSESYSDTEPCSSEALPKVEASDIEYTNKEGFNPINAPKRYCTTIGEFQEVLRRVREQAQSYGCKGGQSKDPAFDAEVDIRWAMCDGQPIPVPKSPADHVAHPRPWCWDDSAFNCRATIAISPIASKGKTKDTTREPLDHGISKVGRPRADSWATNPSIGDIKNERDASSSDLHRRQQPPMSGVSEALENPDALSGYGNASTVVSERRSYAPQDPPASDHTNRVPVHGPSKRWTRHEDSRSTQQGIEQSPLPYADAADTGLSRSGPVANSSDSHDQESDALSFDSQGIPRSEVRGQEKLAYGNLKVAKVNLPRTHIQTSFVGEGSRNTSYPQDHQVAELQALQSTRPSGDASSGGFLRGMLKSPRFSAARIHQSEPFGWTPNRTFTNEGTVPGRARRAANKENVKSEGHQDMIGWNRGLGRSSEDSSRSHQAMDWDSMTHKAQSSLASSSYHAFGHLPQYDGAGDTLGNGRTSGPSSSNKQGSEAVGDSPVDQGPTRADRAAAYDVGATDAYDYRGLTRREFAATRDRPLNARVHRENVDRFLDRIQEEELKEVAATNGKAPGVHLRL
ncbi:MAG: hypothetical protein Q9184_005897 [Pyrenodesmia sp. 2 TL-2023]